MIQSKINSSNTMKSTLLLAMSQEAERTYRILMDHCRKNWLVKKQNRTEVTVSQHSHEGQVQAVTSEVHTM